MDINFEFQFHIFNESPFPKSKQFLSRPGSNAVAREKKDINQRIMLLENRLDGVMISFNATLAQNSNIRKEIDHLVGERAHFNEMIAKLQKKIGGNKKTISDLMELAIQAYDQRDEAQSKIQAMKEKNEKDARNYAEEMKELQRTLDHDEKLKDFLFHKSNDRAFASDFGDDEKGKAKKLEEQKEKENAAKYKEAFEQIKQIVGGDSNLDKITSDFIRFDFIALAFKATNIPLVEASASSLKIGAGLSSNRF